MTNKLMQVIEGALFAASAPLSVDALVKIFPEEEKPKPDAVRKALVELQKLNEGRAIQLVEVATGFRFQINQEVTPYLAKNLLDEKPTRYSRALLETLAIIAYRQPITRGEIEDIRGVVVSTNIVKTLDEQEWIRIVGYKEVPGKPALYATTKTFLDHFGLKSLDELPPLVALKDFDNMGTEFPIAGLLSQEQLDQDLAEVEEMLVGPTKKVEISAEIAENAEAVAELTES